MAGPSPGWGSLGFLGCEQRSPQAPPLLMVASLACPMGTGTFRGPAGMQMCEAALSPACLGPSLTAPETPDAGTQGDGTPAPPWEPRVHLGVSIIPLGLWPWTHHQPLNRVISPRCLPHTSQTFISSSTEA